MRLLPAPMAARIGTVAVAAAIAVAGGTAVASASVPASAGHSKAPTHKVGDTAKQSYQQGSAESPSPSASASPNASASPAAQVATALSIGVTGEVAHNQRIRAVIDGRLFEPANADHGVRGKLVFLLRQGANGHWFVVGQELTGPHGGVAFRVHVFKTATFELAFRGTRHLAAAVSATTTVS